MVTVEASEAADAPVVSIVIPVYNDREALTVLLEGIGRSAVGPREVVVVDDGSTERVDDVVAAAGARLVRLDRNRGPSRARNVGASEARAPILLFIDSDVEIVDGTDPLDAMVRVLHEQPDIDCVSTVSVPQPVVPNPLAYNASLYHAYCMNRFLGTKPSFVGRLAFFTTRMGAIRTEVYRRSGGLYETLDGVMNEDGEYGARCWAMGLRSYLGRDIVHRHRYPTTWRSYLRSFRVSAEIQALVDASMDTSADESVSRAEMLRRLAAGLAPVLGPPLLLLGPPGVAVAAAGGVALVVLFTPYRRLLKEHVPRRMHAAFYGGYVAASWAIFAGYGRGLVRHYAGKTPFVGEPSTLEWFRVGEAPG